MEYDWAANVLPLPCDQRYGAEEMQYIADSHKRMGGNGIMKHRLLILGTLGEFEQLVQKAREKGYYTIVCDGYRMVRQENLQMRAFQIPVTDTERIACLCRKRDRWDHHILFRPSSGMYGKDRGPGRNPLLSETGAASLVS